jgi:hypothetical protein
MIPEELQKQLDELNILWSEIRNILVKEFNAKGDNIAYKKDKLIEGVHLDVAIVWLKNFLAKECQDYLKAKKVVPDTVWAAYKATNTKGTWEQKNLREKKLKLKDAWKSRPSILRRDNVADARTKNKASGKGYTRG